MPFRELLANYSFGVFLDANAAAVVDSCCLAEILWREDRPRRRRPQRCDHHVSLAIGRW